MITALRLNLSDKYPANGMMIAAHKENKLMTKLLWNCEIPSLFLKVGKIGTSIEFPNTSTNGTVESAMYSAILLFRLPLEPGEDLAFASSCEACEVISLVKVTVSLCLDFVVVDNPKFLLR